VREAMDGADVVFHEAAMVSVPASVEAPMDCHGVNGTATLQLLDVARQTDSRVVLASSAAIYGHPKTVPVSESALKQPTSPYGVEKLTNDGTRACTRSSTDWRPSRSGISTSTGRARPASTAASSASFSTRPAPATDHRRGRRRPDQDFVHVDDVVRAKTGWRRRRQHGAARTTSAPDRASRSANWPKSSATSSMRTSPSSIVDPRPNDIQRSRADVSKAREELEFEPTVSLRDGLATTLA